MTLFVPQFQPVTFDAFGGQSTGVWKPSAGTPGSLGAFEDVFLALKSCSNAGFAGTYCVTWVSDGRAPVPGPYSSVLDSAELVWRCASGATIRTAIPCPHPELFGDDDETVDPESLLLASLIDAMVAWGGTGNGDPVVEFVRGRRVRTPRPGVPV